MKQLLLIGSIVLLAACAKDGSGSSSGGGGSAGACASNPLVGSWHTNGASGDVETFNADCTGSSSLCQSTFTYPNATATSGIALVTVTSNGNAACSSVGTESCAYQISGNSLAFDCGAGVSTFTRQ